MPFFLPLYDTNLNFIFIKRALYPQYTLYDEHNETQPILENILTKNMFLCQWKNAGKLQRKDLLFCILKVILGNQKLQ